MKKFLPAIIIFALLFAAACAKERKPAASSSRLTPSSSELWAKSRDSAVAAEATGNKKEKARIAQTGIQLANDCIMKTPEDALCYYWRAVNTGLYYEAHIVGYQDGLKSMVADCEKAIRLNDKIEHGGPYRTLGKIYTDVPETTITKNGVTKDLDLAINYLRKAIQVAPNYPENHIYLAEAFLEAGNNSEAKACLGSSKELVPQWKNHYDYALWLKLNSELAGKIK